MNKKNNNFINIINNGKYIRDYKAIYNCKDKYHLVPRVLEQNNIVNNMFAQNKWSNTCGYGNICMVSQTSKKKYPWNRIPPLKIPASTSVDVNMAWDI